MDEPVVSCDTISADVFEDALAFSLLVAGAVWLFAWLAIWFIWLCKSSICFWLVSYWACTWLILWVYWSFDCWFVACSNPIWIIDWFFDSVIF